MKRGYKALLDEANAEIKAITPAEASKLLGSDGVVFVDLREPQELEREGRIPGAKAVPRGLLEFWIDPDSPYHKPMFSTGKEFVFFCAAGWRSALATKAAQDMGLASVKHIEGGFSAWRDAGLPVDTAPRKA